MLNPLGATIYNLVGTLSIRRRDYATAIVHFSKAIEFSPTLPAPLINRSFAYQATGDYRHAAQDCTRAIELDPGIAMAFYNRGICAKTLEDHDLAISDHSQAVALDPNFAAAFGELGVAYSCKHRHEEAIASFNKAIAIDPTEPEYYRNRGYAQFYRGEFSKASDDLRRSLELEADPFAMLLCYLANARNGNSTVHELERDARALSSDAWPFPAVSLFLGALVPEAALAKASGSMQEAEAHFYLGQWYLLRSNQADAAEAFRRAVRLGPSYLVEYTGGIAELRRLQP
jgi:lipoprotein NlpI